MMNKFRMKFNEDEKKMILRRNIFKSEQEVEVVATVCCMSVSGRIVAYSERSLNTGFQNNYTRPISVQG